MKSCSLPDVVSLLSEESSGENVNPNVCEVSSEGRSRILNKHLSINSIRSTSTTAELLHRKSCAHRAFDYLMSLDLDCHTMSFLSSTEQEILTRIRGSLEVVPSVSKILGPLLSRKWPKWQSVRIDCPDDVNALDILIGSNIVYSLDCRRDWSIFNVVSPMAETSLLAGLQVVKSTNALDVLLESLTRPTLQRLLLRGSAGVSSRAGLKSRILSEYDGRQGTIFGGRNDTFKLMSRISSLVETAETRLIFLSSEVRKLFVFLSFLLDLDTEDDAAWNCALPSSVVRGLASGSISPSSFTRRRSWTFNTPSHLQIYSTREQVETSRILSFLDRQVEQRRVCVKTVVRNVHALLNSIDTRWDASQPEWWWRRQLPRRCSNVLWRCVAELERLKAYDEGVLVLKFLIKNNQSLLGQKRRGKVAIRLLVGLGHLGEERNSVFRSILGMDLFPADRAEIQRRMAGHSVSKFDWPCGPVPERRVTIAGANTREFNWVERAAIDEYYLKEGGFAQGLHCEGSLMMEVFGTLFESVLIPENAESGTLQSPLQKWSLDVGFLQVGTARWSEVEKILACISRLNFAQLAEWHNAQADVGGNAQIGEILECMQGSVLAGIMRLMIIDPFYWGGGHPDLIVWNCAERKVCFSEVKGPGDQLSPRQRWWLAELVRLGANAEVCWVVDEQMVKTVRDVKRRKVSKSTRSNSSSSLLSPSAPKLLPHFGPSPPLPLPSPPSAYILLD